MVLVNPTSDELEAKVVLPELLRRGLPVTAVKRTVFEGLERAASLGPLPESGVVRVPSGAIATVSFERE